MTETGVIAMYIRERWKGSRGEREYGRGRDVAVAEIHIQTRPNTSIKSLIDTHPLTDGEREKHILKYRKDADETVALYTMFFFSYKATLNQKSNYRGNLYIFDCLFFDILISISLIKKCFPIYYMIQSTNHYQKKN